MHVLCNMYKAQNNKKESIPYIIREENKTLDYNAQKMYNKRNQKKGVLKNGDRSAKKSRI